MSERPGLSPIQRPRRTRADLRPTLLLLHNHIVAHGYAPTARELQDLLGARSSNLAQRRLDALRQSGLIEDTAPPGAQNRRPSRGVRLTTAGEITVRGMIVQRRRRSGRQGGRAGRERVSE